MTPPADDEIEICLLGRGNGECVVVHLLNGRWIVVDSFNHSKLLPAAKWYLNSIGVEGSQVEVIVLTHFHADHHRGIADLHDWCPNARLITTGALGKEQFRRLRAEPAGEIALGKIAAMIESAKHRKKELQAGGHLFAQVGQLLVDDRDIDVTVKAMSPTAYAMDESDRELGLALAVGWEAVDTQLRDDNRCSVVIHVDVNGTRALLCADLIRHDEFGWAAVLADPLVAGCQRASAVKAGHHGGLSGHDDEMWAQLVEQAPVVLVAPYRSSGIPTDDDIVRLSGLASEVWEAAPPEDPWIDDDGIQISAKGMTGFARARRHLDENRWRVDVMTPGRQRHP